jgi:hypothetical protein
MQVYFPLLFSFRWWPFGNESKEIVLKGLTFQRLPCSILECYCKCWLNYQKDKKYIEDQTPKFKMFVELKNCWLKSYTWMQFGFNVISNFALSIIDSNFVRKWGIVLTCSFSICIPPWISSSLVVLVLSLCDYPCFRVLKFLYKTYSHNLKFCLCM